MHSLLRAYRSALRPQSTQYKVLIQSVRAEHSQAVQAYIKSPAIACRLAKEIHNECGEALNIVEAVHATGKTKSDTLDAVVSTGERLACRFLTAMLQDQGVTSEFIDLSEECEFSTDQVINQAFYDDLSVLMARRVRASKVNVPVVTGFFGSIPGGLLTRIGRGYTDLCASLLAIGLGAEELQVWKEVEGFYTADPRKVPNARVLHAISPGEASELTFNGSEIIHFVAMGQAMRARVPIRVKNVMNPRGAGTLVRPDALAKKLENTRGFGEALGRLEEASSDFKVRSGKAPTAMTSKHKVVVVNVFSEERSFRPSFFTSIIGILHRWQLCIDLICTSQVQMSMAIQSEVPMMSTEGDEDCDVVSPDLLGAIEQLREIGSVNVLPRMAIISLVGKDMRNSSGTAGRIFTVLGDNSVNIEMIAQGMCRKTCRPISICDMVLILSHQGASEMSISCVVEEGQVDRAMNLLHADLFADLDTPSAT